MLRNTAVGLAIVAGACLSLYVLSSSSSFQACIVHKDNIAIYARCAGRVIYAYRDGATAVSTIFIALFTATLWWSTKGMLNSTRESVELGRREFRSTHRPRIIVRFVQGPFLENAHEGPMYQFIWVTLANVGVNPANIVAFGCDLARRDKNGWRPPGLDAVAKEIAPITLASGERHTFTVRARAPYTDTQIFADSFSAQKLCAVGTVSYSDGNGTVRETGFFRTYDEASEGFVKPENNEDEYQD
jgi:hypothetical protein